MASVEQCEAALAELARRLEEYPHEERRERIPDRTVELTLLDLDISFIARLNDGQLLDIEQGSWEKPNIRLTMNSDDLIDLTDKRLRFSQAWATGRLHLDASLRDLLRLRGLM
ncbi:MAG: SCP2 sterol-binding domain-containing protein [Candidatus Nanopelagicales bacterium]